MSLLANNDVVVHGDAERLCDFDDRLRHLDVRARRRWIATRMIVQEQTMQTSPLIALEFLWSPEMTGCVHWGR